MRQYKNMVVLLSSLCVLAVFLYAFRSSDYSKPRLILIGDSTVRNGQGMGDNGLWGWGSFLGDFVDTSRWSIENCAMGGTSSRTFYTNPNLWTKVKDKIRPGDVVLMQFGHNDASPVVDTLRARGTLRGNGGEVDTIFNPLRKVTEVVHTYGYYLRQYVQEIQERGGIPIICAPVPRNAWSDEGKVRRSSYAEWAREAAHQAEVFFVPLDERIAEKYHEMGRDYVQAHYFGAKDATHTLKEGALLNAKIVANCLEELSVLDRR